eukprot:4017476-Pleurochrysis_carterae.AAC.1
MNYRHASKQTPPPSLSTPLVSAHKLWDRSLMCLKRRSKIKFQGAASVHASADVAGNSVYEKPRRRELKARIETLCATSAFNATAKTGCPMAESVSKNEQSQSRNGI